MHEGMIETSDHGNLKNTDNTTNLCNFENLTPVTIHIIIFCISYTNILMRFISLHM